MKKGDSMKIKDWIVTGLFMMAMFVFPVLLASSTAWW